MHRDQLHTSFLGKEADLAANLPFSDVDLAEDCGEILIHHATSAGCLTFHHVEANITGGNLRRGDSRQRAGVASHGCLPIEQPAWPNRKRSADALDDVRLDVLGLDLSFGLPLADLALGRSGEGGYLLQGASGFSNGQGHAGGECLSHLVSLTS